jgi:smad nuclear-interacting protein 1
MPGDRDREGSPGEDGDRDRGRHHRDEREYSSHRRRRSTSRDRTRVKREEDSPRRNHPRRERSLSPYSKRAQQQRERRHSPGRGKRSTSPEPWGSHQHDLAHDQANPPPPSPPPKQKPNYGLSGLLAAATNTKNGTVLKYNEPPEGKRTKGWRVYIFKDGKEIDVLNLDGQSSFLVGRDRMVVPKLRGCEN